MTMFTDYLLGVWTFYFAIKLIREGIIVSQKSIVLWGASFVATGIAVFIGGTSHGFALYLSDSAKVIVWASTLYISGFISLFFLSAAIFAIIKNPLRNWLIAFIAFKFISFLFQIYMHAEFKYVIYDYIPAMVGVLILQIYGKFSRGDRSANWIIIGILISFAAAGIQQSGFTLHEHFNNNDLYHIIQMGAIFFLYRGGRLLVDASNNFLNRK